MEKGFVDTGPWFEFALNADKKRYQSTSALLTDTRYHWYSSTYVFDELMTLLVSKANKKKALLFGEKIRSSQMITWLHPSSEIEQECWETFKSYDDKEWSYTDCMSLLLIKKHKISLIHSYDHHFSQMGLKLI